MNHQQFRLSNGLETLFIDCPGNTAATVQVWFRAGSALENASNRGIAHFLEHMFFRGTKKRPGAMIAHEVESYGGEINAFTSFDYTCYYINTPISKLDKTIDILLDMVSHPQFKNEDIIPERGVVFEEYRRALDAPGQYSFMRLQKQSFGGSYGSPILGNPKTIQNFSREQLIDFRKKHYNLANALFVVGGDLGSEKDKEKLIKKISAFKLPSGKASSIPRLNLKKKMSIDVFHKEVRMAQLTMAIQAPDFTSLDAASEDLAMNCLAHGETSPLHKKLVLEESSANSCGGSTLFTNKGGVHFLRISFPFENINQVTRKLPETLLELAQKGMQKEEVKKIQQQYVASKLYDLESIEARAFSLGHGFAQNNDVNAEDEFIDRMKKVSTLSVNHSLVDIFSRPIHYSLQIPQKASLSQAEKAIKKLDQQILKIKKHTQKERKNQSKVEQSRFDPQVKVIDIKKGIKFLYRQNTMTPTFVLQSYIKGGLTEESKKNNGIHHLVSSLLTKGHQLKDHDKLKEALENQSASFSGFAGKNAYGMTMHGQSDHFPGLLEDFFDSLLRPRFDDKYLQHEKKMALRTIEHQKEDPVRACFEKVSHLFFGDHPYSQPMLGNEKNIQSFDNKQLLNFHLKSLKQKEILITYCGDLEFEDVLEQVSRKLTSLKTRRPKKTTLKKYSPLKNEKVFIPFEREQTQIFVGISGAPLENNENIYLKMLTAHLSGQSSELFVDVRDRKGLCYSAQPVHFMALEGSYWGIYMASGHDKVTAAKEAIYNIIEKIKKSGLKKSEFNRLKTMIEGQSLINVQTNDDYAGVYSIPLLHQQGVDFYHKNNQFIKKVTYTDFQKEIKKIFKRPLKTVIVGPKEESTS